MPFDNSNYRPIPEGHRRLLVLAEFLETKVPIEKFNLDTWASGELDECGTTACACGWATTIPEFAAAGLTLSPLTVFGRRGLRFDGHASYTAASKFFETDGVDAYKLFSPEAYSSSDFGNARKVAARIRTFVAEQAKVLA